MKKLFTLAILALVSMVTLAQNKSAVIPEETIEFSIDETRLVDYIDDLHAFMLAGEKASGFATYITLYADEIPTTPVTFGYKDIWDEYTYVRLYEKDNDLKRCYNLKATVGYTKAYVDFYREDDGTIYHFIFNIREEPVKIVAEETIEFYVDETKYIDYTSTLGQYEIVGIKPGGCQVSVALYTGKIEGTFDYFDVSTRYTGIQPAGATEFINCFDLNATITKNKANVDFYAVNGVLYHLIFNKSDNPGAEFDNGHEAFDAKYKWAEGKIDESMASVGLETVKIERYINEDITQCVKLEFNCSRGNAVTEIPFGTYEINNTGREMTVNTCEIGSDYRVLGSFVANRAPDGSYYSPLWFLATGTVTVEAGEEGRPHIVVDAKTTWGIPVTLEIGAVDDAIRDVNIVDLKTKKVLDNGKLRILSGGKEYNANGSRVK